MRTSTVRNALINALVTFGLVVSTAAAGSAAPTVHPAVVTFGAGVPASPAATAPTCETGATTCASSDPDLTLAWSSSTSTSGCRFRLVLDWGDGGPAQTTQFPGATTSRVWPVAHRYPSRITARHPYRIQATATVLSDPQALGCSIQSASLTYSLLCTDKQLSGPSWSSRWPGGDRQIGHLNATFGPRVQNFVTAMITAGATVVPQSTLRSPQRSYLMHFSYLVSKEQLAPQAVPAYRPLADEKGPQICWLHRTVSGRVDARTSVAGAGGLLSALGVDSSLKVAPALHSRHNTGDAIDMQIRWTTPSLRIKNAAGQTVKITSTPHDGTNPDLIKVGATYAVNHFSPVAADRNHWSSDGH